MSVSAQEFSEFLVRQASKYDELILKDIKPLDGWIGTVSYGPFHSDWWLRREVVRKIAEGVGYIPTDPNDDPTYNPIGGRLDNAFPHLKASWVASREAITGKPIDP